MKINLLLIVLALIIVCIGLLVKPKEEPRAEMASLEKQPQEFMTQLFVKSYTETGTLKSILSAAAWSYFPEIQSSFLTKPHLTLYKEDGTTWHLDAKQGRTQQSTRAAIEHIELQNQVVLRREPTATIAPVLMETSLLHYYPNKQYVETNQLVTMTRPGLKITGKGLQSFLEQGSVELLNDVKTEIIMSR